MVPLDVAGSRSCVLLGDHLQLPPTVFHPEADDLQINRSMFERLCVLGHQPDLLEEQYRMAPAISAFPRKHFYGGRLLDAPSVSERRQTKLVPSFLLLDLKSHAVQTASGSWQNQEEAKFCARLAAELQSTSLSASNDVLARDIGIITPYKAQQFLIESALNRRKLQFPVRVATVDSYQGQEFEAVICSTVRASHNSRSGIGFVADERRLNVALTRARECLLVVCHAQTVAQSKTLAALLEHAQQQRAFRTRPFCRCLWWCMPANKPIFASTYMTAFDCADG
ncbi:Upf1 [Symbiodinium pilosum]|uniref:Upf1 protein n=1 Tax=Symbiodinium pilosum TaxID=2952 RepID=A0A812MAR7_SYMPI|nr:Upf1 [Symbiodinium pilosum]